MAERENWVRSLSCDPSPLQSGISKKKLGIALAAEKIWEK